MNRKRYLNFIEIVIICVCSILLGIFVISNFSINSIDFNKRVSNKQIQLAVDSFVAKNYIQPVYGNKVYSCLVPKQLDVDILSDYLGHTLDESKKSYFLDYYGTVWEEDRDRLLTVTQQEDFLVFNNTNAIMHKIYQIKDNKCKDVKEIATIRFDENEILYFKIPDKDSKYLIQPIYENNVEGMPVGVGFDGRLYD